MKIKKQTNGFTETETYSISILEKDKLNGWDIAECFKKQFPKELCVVQFSNTITKVEFGLIFVGLNLNKIK